MDDKSYFGKIHLLQILVLTYINIVNLLKKLIVLKTLIYIYMSETTRRDLIISITYASSYCYKQKHKKRVPKDKARIVRRMPYVVMSSW